MRWSWAVLLACGMAMAGDGDDPRDMNGGDGFGNPRRYSSPQAFTQRDLADMQRRLWAVRTWRNPAHTPAWPGPTPYRPWEPNGGQRPPVPAADPTGDPNGSSDDASTQNPQGSGQDPQGSGQDANPPQGGGQQPWQKPWPHQPLPKAPVPPPFTK